MPPSCMFKSKSSWIKLENSSLIGKDFLRKCKESDKNFKTFLISKNGRKKFPEKNFLPEKNLGKTKFAKKNKKKIEKNFFWKKFEKNILKENFEICILTSSNYT